MIPMEPSGRESYKSLDLSARSFKLCANGSEFSSCNWVLPADDENKFCFGCRFNRIIPNQKVIDVSPSINHQRWCRLEAAKKRLMYTLLELKVPVIDGWNDAEDGLLFDFMEDIETESDVVAENIVTGYANGIITINVIEADDVARVSARSALNERQRTILGHFRHESGHFLWDRLFKRLSLGSEFKNIFGDPDEDYQESLSKYYKNGPPSDWSNCFITAYASSHPLEDFAETWNHFLLIFDTVETAYAHGLTQMKPDIRNLMSSLDVWNDLVIALNQLTRSIGINDAYPFVINKLASQKLNYVARLVESLHQEAIVTEPKQIRLYQD
tara:strand:+ start:273 stop:1256 length:984 start_codon:yes stop_codon:yes gene_type:complete